jgi:hypothetical protein
MFGSARGAGALSDCSVKYGATMKESRRKLALHKEAVRG